MERDLHEIAHDMVEWEEKLTSPMELTATDVHDIKKHEDSLELQRYITSGFHLGEVECGGGGGEHIALL